MTRYAATVATAALSVAALGACAKDAATAPDGFGVNVVVDLRAVPPAARARIARGVLTALGPTETPIVRQMAISAEVVSSGELRFRYIPARTSGMLSLTFEVQDSGGAVIASGRTPAMLTLTAGKAVAATIVLSGAGADAGADGPPPDTSPDRPSLKSDGESCAQGSECTSDNCVEGVCCNSACTGLCESCVAGQRGRCNPAPDGTDPKMQCRPTPPPDAGATPDADPSDPSGTKDSIHPPDGGFEGSNEICAGACNGLRACRYPGAEKSCGNRWCNSDSEVAAMSCDGQGGCSPQLAACVDYACAKDACNTRCAAHEDCQRGKTYCNASGQCAPRKADGLGCVTGDECRSDHCAPAGVGAGICCNSACDAPFTCTQTPGKCKCPGVSCATGVACQVFYRDADGDGAGDKFGTLLNGGAQAACADARPAGFVDAATDCDDGDANAKPGQTAFFDVASRSKGTYDYDCDGNIVKGIAEALGSSCVFCTSDSFFSCGKPTATCASAGQNAGLTCSIQCTGGGGRGDFLFCSCQPSDGFVAKVDCGVPGQFKVCGTCPAVGTASSSYSYDHKQSCH